MSSSSHISSGANHEREDAISLTFHVAVNFLVRRAIECQCTASQRTDRHILLVVIVREFLFRFCFEDRGGAHSDSQLRVPLCVLLHALKFDAVVFERHDRFLLKRTPKVRWLKRATERRYCVTAAASRDNRFTCVASIHCGRSLHSRFRPQRRRQLTV